ncbi:MAG TPA: hypothetical protein VFB62_12720, partial [Polyangiaceae bacterium]|nr:hypothetical protein [Polyangiaceae bacterium]
GGKLWSTGATAPAIFKEQQSPLLLDVRRPDGAFDEGPVIPSRGHMRTIAWQGDEVWVAGFYDNIFRSRAGGPFQAVAMPEKNESYEAMWLDELGSAGYLIADRALYERTKDGFKHAHKLAGSASDVHSFRGGNPTWVVGEWAWRYDKGKLQEVPIEGFVPPRHYVLSLGANRIEAVDARSPDDVWMVGRSGLILHYDGKALRELFPLFTEEDFVGVQWIGADTWLAASDDGALIAGSLATGVTDHQKAPLESPRALSKTLAGEVILAGCRTDMFARESNGAWTKLPKLDGCVNDVHGKDREHLWAVGSRDLVDGKAWRLDGGRWIEIPTGMGEHDDLRDVEVAPNGDVWLAGNGFLFRARAGGALVRVAKHEYDDYRQVVVRKPDDVWIATDANEIGSAGTLLHFNGKGFERFDHLTTNFLYSVIALPSGEVWAVGLGGVAAYSRDGKTFRPVQTGTDVTLSYLLAHPSGALLAVGDNGAILQRDAR